MEEWVQHWVDRCLHYYRVNPVIFLTLYVTKSVIWWWTIYHILRNARRRLWGNIPPWVALNVTTNISPWAYIYFWGRNLPEWFPLVLWSMGFFAVGFTAWEVYRRLTARTSPSA